MEKKTVAKKKVIKNKQVNTPGGGRGGAREGCGRPKGVGEHLTIRSLLETLKTKSKGKNYEDILVDDFLDARTNGDRHLTMKYHNLILNKVMVHLTKIEVTDSEETIESKQLAFAEAFAKLTGIKKD